MMIRKQKDMANMVSSLKRINYNNNKLLEDILDIANYISSICLCYTSTQRTGNIRLMSYECWV